MAGELLKIAGQCDGVRCDMAMLVLPDVFERTWGRRPQPFWPRAIAASPRAASRASASWPRSTGTWSGRCSSKASTTPTTSACTIGCARVTPGRCASTSTPASTTRTSSPAFWRTTTSRVRPRRSRRRCTRPPPSSRFSRPACVSSTRASSRDAGSASRLTWCAGPRSRPNERCSEFYDRLLAVLRQPVVRDGEWQLLECAPAWDGNWTLGWLPRLRLAGRRRGAAARRGQLRPHQSQCYVRLPFADLAGRSVRFNDLMGPASYERAGDDILSRGLYLDLPPWGHHVFEVNGPS